MANNKTGFSYYNVDTDRYQDIKIKRLKKDFKVAGIAVYDYILCEIYRVRGCFLVWDENTAFDVAEYFGLKETLVNEIVNYCCAVGLFNKELLTNERVLTSRSIQHRFIEMSTRAKRKGFKIPEEIDIITEQSKDIPEEQKKPQEDSDKEEKSKVNNSLSSSAQVRSEEVFGRIIEKPLTECYQDLSNNHAWAEQVTMNIRSLGHSNFTLDTFHLHLKQFFADIQSRGEVAKSPADAMSHFFSWLKIELKKQEDDRRGKKAFGQNSGAPASRGKKDTASSSDTKLGGAAQKDYSERF